MNLSVQIDLSGGPARSGRAVPVRGIGRRAPPASPVSPIPVEAAACRQLWARVIETALLDATGYGTGLTAGEREPVRRHADIWLRRSPELLTVAALAEIDGRALRQRYIAGLVDMSGLILKRHGRRLNTDPDQGAAHLQQ
ncbi:hypothetical protein SAMN04489859_1006154 [Paracoccus alcaliphilus]|uniref:Uncharacterized protein n=1 Tax=Paracoccus alcaliphilus TaxID=34002 RepID=A0A1H8GGR5_9RHOB|nr:hypothetical protein SAMN04489859_1006154 [Paracoccus alcaliphilus]